MIVNFGNGQQFLILISIIKPMNYESGTGLDAEE